MKVNHVFREAKQADLEGFRAINNLVPKLKPIDPVMKVVARFGPALFLIPLGISYLFAKRYQSEKHRQKLSQAILGTLIVYMINTPLRRLIDRPRPYYSHTRVHRLDPVHSRQSLPSDHATVSFAVARAFRGEPPILRIPTYLLAALISFARVYSGEHYPFDVLSGAVIGLETERQVENNWDAIEDRIENAVKQIE